MEKYFDEILHLYGIKVPLTKKQIYKSTWLIGNSYILKKNGNPNEVEKALLINSFLCAEDIPVAEYLKTVSGESFVVKQESVYTLMYKTKGEHIDPLKRDYISIANNIGVEVARLHRVLKKMESSTSIHKNDLIDEIQGWILSEIRAKNIRVPREIIDTCLEFDNAYHSLPRQLIHRDIQFGNMLFEDDKLSCFLDFDISQENARVFDIVYLVQSMLVGKYNDSDFVEKWKCFTKSFLKSYHNENTLSELEVNAIYKIAVAIQLIFISFFASIGQTDLVPKSVDMVKWVYSNEDVFTFSL